MMALADFLNFDVSNTTGHVQIHAHGRREQANGQVHNHDHAQVDGMDAHLDGHRREQGREDVQGEPLLVKPEEAVSVPSILEAAQVSNREKRRVFL